MKLTAEQRTWLKNQITRADGWKAYRERYGLTSGTMTKDQLLRAAQDLGVGVNIQGLDDKTARDAAGIAPQADLTHDQDQDQDQETPDDVQAIIDRILEPLSPFVADKLLTQVTERLRPVAEKAAKPAEAKTVYVRSGGDDQDQDGEDAECPNVLETKTVGEVFGLKAKGVADMPVSVWDSKYAPEPDKYFVFDPELLADIQACVNIGKPVWLYGPAGTGKTSLPMEYAARTGRPFRRVAFHGMTEVQDLAGSKGLTKGMTFFEEAGLAKAIQVPGTVVLLDEPSLSRPGVLHFLQTLLDQQIMILGEDGGRRVHVAPGVVFFVADNTAGTGDSTGHYVGTGELNRAFLDRFAAHIAVDYLPADKERRIVANKTGVNRDVAELLVQFASKTRAGLRNGTLSMPMGLRRLLSWADLIQQGRPSSRAFKIAVLNSLPEDDQEAYAQLAAADLSHASIDRKATGAKPAEAEAEADPEPATTPQGQKAQQDFLD